MLRGLGVVDGKDRLLRAGEALFCARGDDSPWLLYQHRLSPGGEATAVERMSGPLVTVLDRLIDLVWARRHTTPLTLPDGSQIELADFPAGAVREVAANALLHRELRIDRPVSVEHSASALVVESPGRLVAGDEPGIVEATLESRTRRKPAYRLRPAALQALGSAVTYQRRSIDGAERKVISHLKDYGRINNRTIQNLFDIDVRRASTLLRGLLGRGLLTKTSPQQRGPAVEYGPGPEFP